ncbi:hypothetical protein AA313_de0208806 [Arthrobotrys entomopaga]|nr:hypothetical protein AA313_de0208806 [Arthrobotrys entomopaga]
MASFKSMALLALAAGVASSPVATPTKGEAACAAIASMQKEYKASYAAEHPHAKATPMMSAPVALATECLNSVPINRKVALQQLTGVQRYVQFQTTLSFLKNPPANDSYQAPGSIDIVGLITDLSHKVRSKEVTQEYDFELKLRNIFASANDGHFTGTMGGILAIQFDAPFDIISVSKDGKGLPEIYQAIISQGVLQPVGSPISTIDGMPVKDYLNKIAFGTGLQSPDARYNGLFPTKGLQGKVLNDGFFRHRRRYPGADGFSVTYANGTKQDYQFTATIAGDFQNVTDAASFYDVFVKGGQLLNTPADPKCGSAGSKGRARMGKRYTAWRSAEAQTTPEGVTPNATDNDIFAGYFLKSGTAVIQLTSFEPECWNDVPVTIKAIQKFLQTCRQKGAKSLIVDVTNNGGGYIMMGYDLFMQLFPQTLPYSGQRNRECPAGVIEAKAFADLSFDHLAALANSNNSDTAAVASAASWSNWAYSVNLNDDYKPFKNAKELIGPQHVNNDRFSNLWRFNVTEPIFGLGVENYNAENLTQPFAAENIIVMTDGQCSSTCSTFSEFMQTQGKVRSVAIGGIPNPGRGMPLVGGVRGSEILSYSNLLDSANAVGHFSPTTDSSEISSRNRDLPQKLPLPISGNVNSLDNVRKGYTTPLQFVEEFATCRMFHTKETVGSIEALWNAVDDAAFGSGKGCAVGSLKN